MADYIIDVSPPADSVADLAAIWQDYYDYPATTERNILFGRRMLAWLGVSSAEDDRLGPALADRASQFRLDFEPLQLPRRHTAFEKRLIAFELEPSLNLDEFAAAEGLGSEEILLAALVALLSSCCGQEHIFVEIVHTNSGGDNPLPLHFRVAPELTFRDLLGEAASELAIARRRYSGIPYAHLARLLGCNVLDGRPLCNILFLLSEDSGGHWGEYDLHLTVRSIGGRYLAEFTYNSARFDFSQIAVLIQDYNSALCQAVEQPDTLAALLKASLRIEKDASASEVKVQGHAIDPGLIASQLRGHPGVLEATVEVEGQTEARLLAWIKPRSNQPSDQELRRHLRAILPEYMIPAEFRVVKSAANRAPLTTTAREVASLWSELLKIPSPGRDDSFFDLGAHSILAALFLTMAGRKFGIRLQPRSIFQRPKLQDFADFIDEQILLQRRAQSESGTAA